MKILITGATGFLGSYLLKSLLKKEYDVTMLIRSTSSLYRIADIVSQVNIFDVDQSPLKELFHCSAFDVIIHCATCYGRENRQLRKVCEGNLMFPLAVLEAAIAHQCPYFINTDTFFCKQLPVRLIQQEPLYMPEYTLSKYQFREWGRMYANEGAITFINLQLEHIYGADDSIGKFIPWLEEQFRKNIKYIALTDGIQLRDFVPVENVVEVYLKVLSHLESFHGYCSFEVGTGNAVPLRAFIEKLKESLGADTELCFGEIPRGKNEIMYSAASSLSPFLVKNYIDKEGRKKETSAND